MSGESVGVLQGRVKTDQLMSLCIVALLSPTLINQPSHCLTEGKEEEKRLGRYTGTL